jgi:nitrogen fixation protein FixH
MALNTTELLGKGKTFLSTNSLVIGLAIFLIIVFLFVGFTWGKYHPDPNSAVVQTLLNQKLADEKAKAAKDIKERDDKITIIQNQLNQSYTKNSKYVTETTNLNKQIKSIKPPKDSKETKVELKGLGYETK